MPENQMQVAQFPFRKGFGTAFEFTWQAKEYPPEGKKRSALGGKLESKLVLLGSWLYWRFEGKRKGTG